MKPLEGVRVLDLTQAYSGPFCTMHLADHGAEVIKVESLSGDQCRTWGPLKNGHSAYYAYINRNKRGIRLDLKTERGKEALRRLPGELREVIILRYFTGLTLEETAKALEIPRGTVTSRQKRALGLLRLELAEEEDRKEAAV